MNTYLVGGAVRDASTAAGAGAGAGAGNAKGGNTTATVTGATRVAGGSTTTAGGRSNASSDPVMATASTAGPTRVRCLAGHACGPFVIVPSSRQTTPAELSTTTHSRQCCFRHP